MFKRSKRETAWAIEIEPENFGAILSEGSAQINREFLDTWLEKYPEGGYFVRDEGRSRFDCTVIPVEQFWDIYRRIDREICDPGTLNDGLVECNGAHFFPIESDFPDSYDELKAS